MGYDQKARTDLVVEALAGLTAGLVATTLLHPIDMVKVRLQARQTSDPRGNSSITTAKRILVYEGGLRALYRGLTPNVLGNSASWALYFLWYDRAKKSLKACKETGSTMTYWDYMITSSFASIATSSMTNPIWVIKTRMLTTPQAWLPSMTVTRCIRHVYHSDGLSGFYRGLVPSLLGTLSFSIQFSIYEKLKAYRGARSRSDLNSLDYITYSACSKLIAGFITYPYQVLRTRMQAFVPESEAKSLGGLVKHIWRTSGVRGFYHGLGPSTLRVLPSTCVTFLIYEEGRKGYRRLLED